jgi:methyl-accepting chemotaxis protein
VDDLKGASGIEDISVLNFQGREAFNKEAPVTEAEIMRKISGTKASYDRQDVKRFIFYEPLQNKETCRACHAADPEIIGAVKVSVSIENEYARSMDLIRIVILLTVLACFCFSIILWLMIRKMVISPIKLLEKAAHELSRGDLSFDVDLKSNDEIGRFSRAVKDSMISVSGILKDRDISAHIAVLPEVEVESEKRRRPVLSEAIPDISASVEEIT